MGESANPSDTDIKRELNDFLWKNLNEETTLKEADDLAMEIFLKIKSHNNKWI